MHICRADLLHLWPFSHRHRHRVEFKLSWIWLDHLANWYDSKSINEMRLILPFTFHCLRTKKVREQERWATLWKGKKWISHYCYGHFMWKRFDSLENQSLAESTESISILHAFVWNDWKLPIIDLYALVTAQKALEQWMEKARENERR